MLRNKWTIALFMAPASVLYLTVVLYPICQSLYYGFFSWDLVGKLRFIGIQNYVRMFTTDSVFPITIRNIFFFLVTGVILQLVAGYGLAVLLTMKIPGKSLFKNLFFLPAVIPSAAIGLIWSFMYNPQFGVINGFLRAIGLGALTRPWLLDQSTSLWAVTITICWQYTGYAMIIFIAGIQGVPSSLFDAARIDGASSWGVVRNITIPLTLPVIKIETILIAIGSLKIFDLVYVMTRGGPVHSTEVLATYIYSSAFFQLEYGYGDALSVVLLVLCLLVTLVINRFFRVTDVEY